jgi:hypothetical protein
MKYYDYEWDLYPEKIVLDNDLNTDRLTWQAGQYWQMCEEDGNKLLRRVDPIVQFLLEGKE